MLKGFKSRLQCVLWCFFYFFLKGWCEEVEVLIIASRERFFSIVLYRLISSYFLVVIRSNFKNAKL